jgi:hypothetical protein
LALIKEKARFAELRVERDMAEALMQKELDIKRERLNMELMKSEARQSVFADYVSDPDTIIQVTPSMPIRNRNDVPTDVLQSNSDPMPNHDSHIDAFQLKPNTGSLNPNAQSFTPSPAVNASVNCTLREAALPQAKANPILPHNTGTSNEAPTDCIQPHANLTTPSPKVPLDSSDAKTNSLSSPDAIDASKPSAELSHIMTALTLPKVEIAPFGGDVLSYQPFMEAFKIRVDDQAISSRDKLLFLNQSLIGEAKDLVSGCIYMAEGGYEQAMKLLRDMYGSSYKLSSAINSKYCCLRGHPLKL